MSTQKKSLPASMAGLPPGGWGMSRAVSAANRYALSAVLALAALIIWQAVSFFGSIEPWLLPSPGEVLESFADDTSLIFRHAWVTAQEALLGFLIAVAVGFGLALGITSFRAFEKAVYPYVIASQAVPIIAIAPVLVVWFGFGLMPKIIVIVLITFFPVAINTVDGLRNVDPDMMTLMRTMGASRWQVFRLVRLPSALPLFFSGVKIAAAVSVIGAVLGEWVGASEGLGYLITRSSAQFLTARVFASIFVLSAMGLFLFFIVSRVERAVTPWAQRGGDGAHASDWS